MNDLNKYRQDCRLCGYLNGKPSLVRTPNQPHYGKLVCPQCGAYWRWAPKPDSDSSKYRRPAEHRELVAKFSDGYCEMCLTGADNLPGRQTLHAHHVVPYEVGGGSNRENIWIVCTRCHRQIELIRTYNPAKVEFQEINS